MPGPHPFAPERLAFIEYGETEKREIRRAFGDPLLQRGNFWLYGAQRRGTEWVYIIVGGYGTAGGGEFKTKGRGYYLFVEFDAEGLVSMAAVTRDRNPCVDLESGRDYIEVCYRDRLMRGRLPDGTWTDL